MAKDAKLNVEDSATFLFSGSTPALSEFDTDQQSCSALGSCWNTVAI